MGFTEQSPVHSECRPALKVWWAKQKVSRASREGPSDSLQVSWSRQKAWRVSLEAKPVSPKVSRASLNGTRAKQKVSRLTLRVRLSTLFSSHSTLCGSMEGDGAAMKPDFTGFMAVEQSRIMRCGCRERVLEPTAPVRQAPQAPRAARPEACGRNACPSHRRPSAEWPPHMASW